MQQTDRLSGTARQGIQWKMERVGYPLPELRHIRHARELASNSAPVTGHQTALTTRRASVAICGLSSTMQHYYAASQDLCRRRVLYVHCRLVYDSYLICGLPGMHNMHLPTFTWRRCLAHHAAGSLFRPLKRHHEEAAAGALLCARIGTSALVYRCLIT